MRPSMIRIALLVSMFFVFSERTFGAHVIQLEGNLTDGVGLVPDQTDGVGAPPQGFPVPYTALFPYRPESSTATFQFTFLADFGVLSPFTYVAGVRYGAERLFQAVRQNDASRLTIDLLETPTSF